MSKKLSKNLPVNQAVNFSTWLLELFARKHASRLLVLPVQGVTWSDWGSERRLVGTPKKLGHLDRVEGGMLPRAHNYLLDDTHLKNGGGKW